MSLTERLQQAGSTPLPPLDHEHLQRAGRRRRRAVHGAGGIATVAVVAAAVVGVQQLALPSSGDAFLGSAPQEQPPAPDAPGAEERSGDDRGRPDPAVVQTFGQRSHDEVVVMLRERLAANPERPADLISVTQHLDEHGAWQIRQLTGAETADDFPVINVLDADFDPSRWHETPAFEPTWTHEAAERALDAFAEAGQFRYVGVDVDALGRTVLVFGARPAELDGSSEPSPAQARQRVHVDPQSGYTTGTSYLEGERVTD